MKREDGRKANGKGRRKGKGVWREERREEEVGLVGRSVKGGKTRGGGEEGRGRGVGGKECEGREGGKTRGGGKDCEGREDKGRGKECEGREDKGRGKECEGREGGKTRGRGKECEGRKEGRGRGLKERRGREEGERYNYSLSPCRRVQCYLSWILTTGISPSQNRTSNSKSILQSTCKKKLSSTVNPH